jgi:hypothetical protein
VDRESLDECVPNYVAVVFAELACVEGRPDARDHLALVKDVFGDRAELVGVDGHRADCNARLHGFQLHGDPSLAPLLLSRDSGA